jgi:hypothetical protein
MATLTYDSTPADQPEFNEQEVEALKVGEEAAQEQNQMLAGKFKDAEALEQAYIELQKKLGEPTNENETTEVRREEGLQEQRNEEEVSSTFLDQLWNESQSEYTEDTLKTLGEMNAKELAQMYLEYRHQAETQSAPEISPEIVTNLQNIAGGEEAYGQMIQWAAQSLSKEEVTMFDNVIERGDPQACFFAIQSLNQRFTDAVGKDGKVLTGYAPQEKGNAFRSQAEVVAAMQDPRYDKDPAYRNDVFEKLNRSNLNY